MNWKSVFPLVALMSLMVLATSQAAVASNPTTDTVLGRVPATALASLESLPFTAVNALDYGAFYWLEITSTQLAQLQAANIPFELDSEAGLVQITRYRFNPLTEGEPAIPAELRAEGNGRGLHLIQFAGPIRTEWVSQLKEAGLPMLQYYPHHAYLTWATPAQLSGIESMGGVRWHGAVHPAYKLSETLDGRTGLIRNVNLVIYNDGQLDQTLKQVQALGGQLLQAFPSQPDLAFYDALLVMDAAVLPQVAQIPNVLWVGYIGDTVYHDDEMSSQIVAGNYSGANVPFTGYNAYLANLGYTGAGVTWAVVDTGVDYTHPDLGPSIVGGYSFPGVPAGCATPAGNDCAGGGHGTHVAGIIGGDATAGFADANGFLYGLGVAPGYGIFAMNSLMGASWPPAGGWQENSKQAILGGSVGTNNSWHTGEGTAHGYQASERTHDLMVRDGNFDTAAVAEPIITVFSAGNSGSGPSTLTAPKEAKNVIVTASSVNYRAGSINSISGFSSRGPAVDGRHGITVAAPGEQIASSRNSSGGSCSTAIAGTSNLYAFCSGTSMAAPQVSGALALITEWWRTWNAGQNPSPAMAKALLVNGAVDMGTPDIPNTNEGWGRVNVTNVISPSTMVVYYDQTHLFTDTGQEWALSVGVVDPTKPVKVTLVWSDAPGAVGANPALVNNLNLRVEANSQTYLGNVFSGGWSNTGGTADTRNNIENVYLTSATGTVAITVIAANIAGDGVPYNGDATDQDFALICYNCALGEDFTLGVTPSTQDVCAPSNAVYTVNVGSILGYNDPVTLSAINLPSGATADFSVNPVTPNDPPNTSVFTVGSLGSVSAGNYAIQVLGIAPTSTHTATVGLNLFTAVPDTVTLLTPANGANNIPTDTSLTWNAASQASSYLVEVATDAGFSNIVYSATVNSPTANPTGLNTSTNYYWRVTAENLCGTNTPSTTFMFRTASAPGDCDASETPVVFFQEGFESGAPGWSTAGSTGASTWASSSVRTNSGNFSYRAIDINTVSDQRLASPPVLLTPGLSNYTLQFWNHQTIESATSGCFDAGIIEISTNGGSSWTQLTSVTHPYDGTISASWSNPLGGLQGWCGNPRDWHKPVVNLSAYEGQTVNFRFRLGTDSSVGLEGWYVDDVTVQACQTATPSYGVVLSEDDAQTAVPATTITYTVHLTNTGNVSDTFDLSLAGHSWDTQLSQSSISLLNGVTGSVEVTVDVPAGALAGEMDVVTVTATSQTDGSATDTVQLTSTADAVHGFLWAADTTAHQGHSGQTVTYTISLTNTGNITDTYDISLAGHSWPTTASHSSLTLGAQAMASFTVAVVVDGDVYPAGDVVTVTAVSQADNSITETVALHTTLMAEHGVVLSSDHEAQTAEAGTIVTYTLTLTNTGNLTDTFDLALAGHGWATAVADSAITLAAGASADVTLTVTIPLTATHPAQDTVTVTAVSQGDSDVSAHVALTTAVLRTGYHIFLPLVVR